MKKVITSLFFLVIASFSTVFAQNESDLYTPVRSSATFEGAEADATLRKITPSVSRPINPNLPEAMFDVQFVLRPNDSLPTGIAKRAYGVLWTGTEFWVAQWTSDSIARYSQTGKLLGFLTTPNLPTTTGNTGIRGFTMEGSNIWAVNTSNVIMRLNPTTAAIVETITIPAVLAGARFAAWDPTEGGGFWCGNFSTDLYKVSKSGVIIRTIPRATHGLIGMSGAAYDSVSVGGAYLWVNCQSDFANTGTNSSVVRQVHLPTGIGTSVVRDLKTNVPALNANLAGGAAIATLPGLTKPTLLMIAQNTTANSGVLIGYELNFVQPTTPDMSLDSVNLNNGFTVMPLRHRNPTELRIKTRNIGFTPVTSGRLLVEMTQNGLFPFDQNLFINIPTALSLQTFSMAGSHVPTAKGVYNAYVYMGAAGDANSANDTASVTFAISDSTYATDNVETPNVSPVALSIAGTATPGQKRLGMTYRLPVASMINSVTVQFRPSLAGDSTQIKIYKVVNGIPSDSIASSPIYVTTANDAVATPVVRVLQLTRPLTVAANEEFVICMTEGRGSLRIASTTKGYRPKTTWAFGTFWINTDTFSNANFRAALYLRPNVNIRTGTNDVNSNISTVKAFPNPVTDALTVSVQLAEIDNTIIALHDIAGRLVFQDKTVGNQSFTKNYPLSILPSGMYILTVSTAKGSWQEKVFKD